MDDEIWTEGALWRGYIVAGLYAIPTVIVLILSMIVATLSLESKARETKNDVYRILMVCAGWGVLLTEGYCFARILYGASITIADHTIRILPALFPPTCELAKKLDPTATDPPMICLLEEIEKATTSVGGIIELSIIYIFLSALTGLFCLFVSWLNGPTVDIYCKPRWTGKPNLWGLLQRLRTEAQIRGHA